MLAQSVSTRDWTLHSSPSPAYPSYRLITALRLYHLAFGSGSDSIIRERVLGPWQDTLHGRCNMVSEENEIAWRESLIQICEILMRRAETGIHTLAERTVDFKDVSWLGRMQDNIKVLWQEEALVAAAVVQSIRQGAEF
jgi:hypothetical protein